MGKAYNTIEGGHKGDGGASKELAATAKRSTHGMRPGIGLSRDRVVEPFRERNSAGQSFKTISPRAKGDSGGAVDEWCRGKRKDYK